MLTKSKSVLSDGTRVEDLINKETREVSMRVLHDRELYELELEQIFGKTWLLLAHESEIPKSGDYVVRSMGEDQVIVSRDREDQVHVMLNVCPHRGMRICMGDRKSTRLNSSHVKISYAVFCLIKNHTTS